jgi:hypothetical protein
MMPEEIYEKCPNEKIQLWNTLRNHDETCQKQKSENIVDETAAVHTAREKNSR